MFYYHNSTNYFLLVLLAARLHLFTCWGWSKKRGKREGQEGENRGEGREIET